MANKRMFSLSIVDTDYFLDMPVTSQALYFHLGMRADDDGFIDNPKKIIRMVGFNEGDINILFDKGFVIPFESGVCVIRHWRINNYLRSDRYHSSIYTEEKSLLNIEENGTYSVGIPQGLPNGIPDVKRLATETSIDKSSIEEKRDREYAEVDKIIDYFNEVTGKSMKHKKSSREPISARLKDGFTYEDAKTVIDWKYKQWKDDFKMSAYIKISTLFAPSHFEEYLQEDKIIPITSRDYNRDAVIGVF